MIKRRNTNAEVSTQGLGYTHEQRYGLITSLSTHLIVFILFFALSVHKSSRETPVVIRADRDIRLQVFVDVLDIINNLGFRRVTIQTEKGGEKNI